MALAGLALADARPLDAARPLPQVIYGPPVDQFPQPADAPSQPAEAAPVGPTGRTCEAVLFLARVNRFCALKTPLPLGADCECPFPPPPPGILPSPPSVGRVVP